MILPADLFYIKAFYDLSTCRDNGFSMGPIPWTAKIKYTEWYRLENDITEAFVDIICEMDEAYRAFYAEENKPKKPKKKLGT